jgi:hypothetical protein
VFVGLLFVRGPPIRQMRRFVTDVAMGRVNSGAAGEGGCIEIPTCDGAGEAPSRPMKKTSE